MKRYIIPFLILAASLLAAPACTKAVEEEIEGLRKEVSELESRVTEINKTLNSLSQLVTALEQNDHIKSIRTWGEHDYVISFSSGTVLFLYNGKTGVTPIVGVQYYEAMGNYYWTIQMGPDGKVTWMTNSTGQRVRATGLVPQMKIEDGIWKYSFDGKNWTTCQWGSAEGKPGAAVFQRIDTSDPYYVVFTLANGTEFKIPTQKGFDELSEMCDAINEQSTTWTIRCSSNPWPNGRKTASMWVTS